MGTKENKSLQSFIQLLNFPVILSCLFVTQIPPFFRNHMRNGPAAAPCATLHVIFLRQDVQAAKSQGQGKQALLLRKCLIWLTRKIVCEEYLDNSRSWRSGRDNCWAVGACQELCFCWRETGELLSYKECSLLYSE